MDSFSIVILIFSVFHVVFFSYPQSFFFQMKLLFLFNQVWINPYIFFCLYYICNLFTYIRLHVACLEAEISLIRQVLLCRH